MVWWFGTFPCVMCDNSWRMIHVDLFCICLFESWTQVLFSFFLHSLFIMNLEKHRILRKSNRNRVSNDMLIAITIATNHKEEVLTREKKKRSIKILVHRIMMCSKSYFGVYCMHVWVASGPDLMADNTEL